MKPLAKSTVPQATFLFLLAAMLFSGSLVSCAQAQSREDAQQKSESRDAPAASIKADRVDPKQPVYANPAPAKATTPAATDLPIMKLADVRIGMKGYGLTVFHGTKIEPFPVEVISIQNDFAPNRGVVWIRCPDDRMQLSGPVHGMSGSPIFLWPLGEEHEIGEGGSVIGAFAFGYQLVKDCYVGVQPIEYMLEAAGRVDTSKQASLPAGPAGQTHGDPAAAVRMIRTLIASGRQQGATRQSTWQAAMLANLIDPARSAASRDDWRKPDYLAGQDWAMQEATLSLQGPSELAHAGQPRRLLVPLSVSSPAAAQLMTAVLQPMGLQPLATAGSGIAGRPPVEIDADNVSFAPGSVLAVPLAWGDTDLSASGTVTALTTDDTVVGFGHAMFGDGQTALPMATGYVHFVMPNIVSSFKMGGTLQLKGALLRDEQAAVAGSSKGTFTTAPVNISVTMPGQETRNYKYQVVHHQSLTPVLSAIVAMQSVTAVQNPPTLNTLHIKGTIRFSDDKNINLSTLMPMADPSAVAMQILPALATMANNPFESRQVKAIDMTASYTSDVRISTLSRGRLSKPIAKPGEKVDITLWLQPYGGELYRKHVSVTVPTTLPDGDYQIVIGNGQTYMGMLMGTRPHLSNPSDIDSLFSLVKRVMEVDPTAIYVLMQSNSEGLAVGNQEMPQLPSSQKALLTGSASTQTTPYQEWIDQKFDTPDAIDGLLAFTLQVRRSGELTQSME